VDRRLFLNEAWRLRHARGSYLAPDTAETPGDLPCWVVDHASDQAVAVRPAFLDRCNEPNFEHRFHKRQSDKALEFRDAKLFYLRVHRGASAGDRSSPALLGLVPLTATCLAI